MPDNKNIHSSENSNAATAPILADDANYAEKTWKDSTFFAVCKQFVRKRTAIIGFLIIAVLAIASIAAPLLVRYDYTKVDPMNAFQHPNAQHWFGTDHLGRDIYARMLYGGRYSLTIGISAELLGMVIGITLGSIAGYFGKWVENVILRICDVFQNIPHTLLCICIAQALGGGFVPTLIALAIGGVPGSVRMLRATMLNVREQEYIEAAQAIPHSSKFHIITKHILPNCMTPSIVQASMGIGSKIIESAGLSFLGLGIQEPTPEWGAMISLGRNYMRFHPYLIIIPGIFVAMTVLSFNMIGDGLRDALDPKQRR